jgi:hypothetical protein
MTKWIKKISSPKLKVLHISQPHDALVNSIDVMRSVTMQPMHRGNMSVPPITRTFGGKVYQLYKSYDQYEFTKDEVICERIPIEAFLANHIRTVKLKSGKYAIYIHYEEPSDMIPPAGCLVKAKPTILYNGLVYRLVEDSKYGWSPSEIENMTKFYHRTDRLTHTVPVNFGYALYTYEKKDKKMSSKRMTKFN